MLSSKKVEQAIEDLEDERDLDEDGCDEEKNNKLTIQEAVEELNRVQQGQSNLHLALRDIGTNDGAAELLAEAVISTSIRLENDRALIPIYLDLSSNSIADYDLGYIAGAIKGIKYHFHLDLCDNYIEDRGAKLLGKGVEKAQAPITLDLNNNDIDEDGSNALVKAAKRAKVPFCLKTFCLKNGRNRGIVRY